MLANYNMTEKLIAQFQICSELLDSFSVFSFS